MKPLPKDNMKCFDRLQSLLIDVLKDESQIGMASRLEKRKNARLVGAGVGEKNLRTTLVIIYTPPLSTSNLGDAGELIDSSRHQCSRLAHLRLES